MPTAFQLQVNDNVTSSTTVYTVPGATTALVIGLNIANDAGADVTVTVSVTHGGTTAKLCSSTPLPATASLTVLNNNSRLVMEAGDTLTVSASGAVDVAASIMELS